MAQFQDAEGRKWPIRLTVADIRAANSEAGFDFADLFREEKLTPILDSDPMVIPSVTWVVCRREAERRGVDEDSFFAGFDGATMESATNALLEAAIVFFRRGKEAEAATRRLPDLLAKIDAEQARKVEAAMVRAEAELSQTTSTSSQSAVNSPESAESTPPA